MSSKESVLRVLLAQVTQDRNGPNGLLKVLSSLADSENWLVGQLEQTQPGRSRCVGNAFVTCSMLPYTSKHFVAKSADQLDAEKFIPLFCGGGVSQVDELKAFVAFLLDRGLRMCVTLPMIQELKNWVLLQQVCETDLPTWSVSIAADKSISAAASSGPVAKLALLPSELKKLHQSMVSMRDSLQDCAGPEVCARFQPISFVKERVSRDLRDVQSDAVPSREEWSLSYVFAA